MSDPITKDEMLDALESMLKAQLMAVRTLRANKPRKVVAGRAGGQRSNMAVIEDILLSAGEPLHVNEIIARAKRAPDHRVLKRESIVSALTKKVLDRQTFKRTGPNVFGLLSEDKS